METMCQLNAHYLFCRGRMSARRNRCGHWGRKISSSLRGNKLRSPPLNHPIYWLNNLEKCKELDSECYNSFVCNSEHISWDTGPCSAMKVKWRFGGTCSLYLQVPRLSRRRNKLSCFLLNSSLERGSLGLVGTIEELLGRKSSGSGLEYREYGRMDPSCWPRGTLYPQTLTLISPTSLGRYRSLADATLPPRRKGSVYPLDPRAGLDEVDELQILYLTGTRTWISPLSSKP
jgi:hypothetical protein